MFVASIVGNLGNQLYYWGIAPVMGAFIVAAGSILQVVGLYRAGADEPGFYRALLYAAVSIVVGQMSGYFQMDVSLLVFGAALLLSLCASNLACAAAGRLLRLADQEPLAFLGDVVVKLNVVCYIAAILGMLLVGLSIGVSFALMIVSWVLTAVCLVFLFKAGRALRVKRENI